MRFNSIRFKTNILYTVILGIILSVYSGVLFYAVHTILYRDLDESLLVKAKEVGEIIHAYEQAENQENYPMNILPKFLGDELNVPNKVVIDELWHSEVKTLNLKYDYIHILTSKGHLILASENVKEQEGRLFTQQFPFAVSRIVFKDIKDENHHLRAINLPFSYKNYPWLIVQIGTPLTSTVHTLNKIRFYIVLCVLFVLILTSFLGSVFAKSVLTPVMQIAEAADHISLSDLHIRIGEKQNDEEIRHLIKSFNTMLGRLEESFGHINEFSSLVAHELKTPLAILRGEMELALSEKQSADEYKRVLEAGIEEINRITKIIKDLLLLANLDYRLDIFKFERINLIEFISTICENGKVLALEKKIKVTSEIPQGELYIDGDKVHLRRLFFNLINNAIKFTGPEGKIHIVVKKQINSALISIADTGIGISKEDLSKLFTKFFRVRKESSPELSSGLGLNIAQSIAKAHHGEIKVTSELNKGTTFTITFPLT